MRIEQKITLTQQEYELLSDCSLFLIREGEEDKYTWLTLTKAKVYYDQGSYIKLIARISDFKLKAGVYVYTYRI